MPRPPGTAQHRRRDKQAEAYWARIHGWTVRIAVPVIIMLAVALVLRLTVLR